MSRLNFHQLGEQPCRGAACTKQGLAPRGFQALNTSMGVLLYEGFASMNRRLLKRENDVKGQRLKMRKSR